MSFSVAAEDVNIQNSTLAFFDSRWHYFKVPHAVLLNERTIVIWRMMGDPIIKQTSTYYENPAMPPLPFAVPPREPVEVFILIIIVAPPHYQHLHHHYCCPSSSPTPSPSWIPDASPTPVTASKHEPEKVRAGSDWKNGCFVMWTGSQFGWFDTT